MRRSFYALLTFRDYTKRLNRCAEVEQELFDASRGKKALTTVDLRRLANKLGGIIGKKGDA
jgi:hypothetical protein